MHDLGTLGGPASIAYGINGGGQVVGQASTADGSTRAFLYSGGALRHLNSVVGAELGITFTDAWGINDNGQIAANGYDSAGTGRAYLLTPERHAGGDGGAGWPLPAGHRDRHLDKFRLAAPEKGAAGDRPARHAQPGCRK
jgi:probable HAF family extracellular repeat protein